MLTNGLNSRIATLSNKVTLSPCGNSPPSRHKPLQDLISIHSLETCWHSDSKVSVSFWHALLGTENDWRESHTVCKVGNRKGTDVWSFSPILLSIVRKSDKATYSRKERHRLISPSLNASCDIMAFMKIWNYFKGKFLLLVATGILRRSKIWHQTRWLMG